MKRIKILGTMLVVTFFVGSLVTGSVALAIDKTTDTLPLLSYGSGSGYTYGTGNIDIKWLASHDTDIELKIKDAEAQHLFHVWVWVDIDWTEGGASGTWPTLFYLGNFSTDNEGEGEFEFENTGQNLPNSPLPTGAHTLRFVITDANYGDQGGPPWRDAAVGSGNAVGQSVYITDESSSIVIGLDD